MQCSLLSDMAANMFVQSQLAGQGRPNKVAGCRLLKDP